ncbi:hypothetical protein EMIHUDRAFT_459817 [Emiliania huxleyi CCMP1516]|uniref:Amine oxidase domain-containing protein n=2 Tax=Emiliania huxleyi TaxID=2903 RepID=A0A0D3IHQ1_EMIH1|nr:hypothetical protein EMIHUDRAFT_459817 [Emiliania huxleyi CCMP1516]EOD10786.1 hypothetical protein EMIHUDRAFT_459817 [Emiliania huxleyi CCMP1516]|eukprot:XP_005763215.1 hypothetical protein EMIHUDRAFT_459817 [Emiliania huxleyi CCMP1516]
MLTAFVLLLSAAVLLYLLFLAWPRCSLRCHALAPGARAAPLAGTACLKEGFASRKVPEQLDTIVIGSGAAGLTAAALLAKRGQRVLVLEQHDVAGGCTHTFEERGFEFDVGLHYVGDILGVLLNAVTSGVIEWAPTGRLVDEVYFGDDVVPILSPKAAFLAELRRRFPSEGAALHSYSWRVLLAHVWLGAHLGLKVLPAALAAPLLRALGGMQTTQTALERLTGSPKLRHVLSYIWGTYGVPPSRSPFAFHLLAARIVPTVLKAGGAVLVRAPVTSLVCDEAGAVRGVVVRGRLALRAAHASFSSLTRATTTFCHLVPPPQRHRLAPLLASIRDAPPVSPPASTETQVEPSLAFLYLFLGLSADGGGGAGGSGGSGGGLPRHNIWKFGGWDHERGSELPPRLDDVAADHPLLLFLSSPSAKDPAWEQRHPGKQVVLALAPTRFEYWAEWRDGRIHKRGEAYDRLKRALTERMTEEVLRLLPQLRGRVEYCDLGTPLSSNFYLGTRHGEAYGLAHTPARFAQPWLTPRTPLPGLYLAGQDVATDGVTGGVISGFMAAGAVDKTVFVAEAATLLAAGVTALAT